MQFFFVVMGIGLFVGLGDMLGGYDRYIYAEYFDQAADVGETATHRYLQDAAIFSHWADEKGYGWLNVAISFVTNNRYIFILIFTLIVYFLLFLSIKEYVDNNVLGLIVFMALLFFFTFTYLRQVIGFSIAWLGIKYIYERKLWKFALIMYIAHSMHNSAIILAPIYFIPIKKYDQVLVKRVLFLCLLMGVFGISSTLYQTYSDVSDTQRVNTFGNQSGFRMGYFIEAVVFAYIILKNYERIPNTRKHVTLMNLGLYFCCILLLFIRSENGGRLSWYYAIGVIATLANIATYTYEKKVWRRKWRVKRVMPYHIFLLLLCFFLYWRILRGWGEGGYQILYPYKTFLTNGHRKPDRTFDEYEYDLRYDKDKFYR